MKRALVILGIVSLLVGFVVLSIPHPRWELRSNCPSGDGYIMGLPFKGQQQHPLDGTLRLFWVSREGSIQDVRQTSIPWVTRGMQIEWISDAKPPSFVIRSDKGPSMVWRLEGEKMVCVQGNSFIADNPYAVHNGTESK